jgi:predicted outer membrane repeat protein
MLVGHHSLGRGRRGRALRVEPLEDRRLMAMTVSTLVDENDGVAVGGISLREAVAAAGQGETIDFAPALTAGGPAKLLLTKGEMLISKSLTIEGPGADLLTVDASGSDPSPSVKNGSGSRIFNIYDGDDLEVQNIAMSGLRLTGGDSAGPGGAIFTRENLALSACVLADNATNSSGQRGGGAIYSFADSARVNALTLVDCELINNRALRDEGGAIQKGGGTLVLQNCVLSDNSAASHGGAISAANQGVAITIVRSTAGSNMSGLSGGGIFLYSGFVTVRESHVTGNTARHGGGLFQTGSRGTITGSTFSQNVSTVDGGGAYTIDSELTITGSTFSSNVARGYAGGIAAIRGTLDVRHSTLVLNRADDNNTGNESGGAIAMNATAVTLDHALVAANRRGAARSDILGPIAARFSLIGDRTDATITDNGGNILGTAASPINPLIGPLAASSLLAGGFPMPTHALLTGSPALDAGDAAAIAGVGNVPRFDQRGTGSPRIYNGDQSGTARIDIGAYELRPNGVTADFDGNHVVDGNDFLVWQRGLDASGAPASHGAGNADGDADVDAVDLAVLQAAFGAVENEAGEFVAAGMTNVDLKPTITAAALKSSAAPPPTFADLADAAMAFDQLAAATAPRRGYRPAAMLRR